MDKNTVIGFSLIFLILIGWNYMNAPTAEEIERQEQRLDSLKQVKQAQIDSLKMAQNTVPTVPVDMPDSLKQLQLSGTHGGFAPAATGTAEDIVLENDVLRVTFSTKGGVVKSAELKKYSKMDYNKETHEPIYTPLILLEDAKNRFEYVLPLNGQKEVSSQNLFFKANKQGNSVTFSAPATNGGAFEQSYTLEEGSYSLEYVVNLNNLNGVLNPTAREIKLNWVNHLDKLEENTKYERNYATVYYKPNDDDFDNCSCTSDDVEELEGQRLDWLAHSNQFFATALLTKDNKFKANNQETILQDESADNLKILKSEIVIPFDGNTSFAMDMFMGPTQYELLESYGKDLTDIIPFGTGIFGTVNRWIVRPIFQLLSSFIGNAGVVILLLTIIVKLLVFPLTYKMIHSQSIMAALKPQLTAMKDKYKDDQQKQQMESMKLYREFGVNPMGGCLPMAFQMPIWFALYRFFPASIEFRQEAFLWAKDLSSYDVAFWLPFEIPFYGDHVSLFTLLWALTTVAYSWYNMRHLDMNAMSNPMMKYMQYGMPIMFLFFFNGFSSGLTCYLFFSSLFNIAQTVITKNYLINHDKIKKELAEYKKKPKKKGGFQERLAKALEEQQKIQAERDAAAGNKKKRKR